MKKSKIVDSYIINLPTAEEEAELDQALQREVDDNNAWCEEARYRHIQEWIDHTDYSGLPEPTLERPWWQFW